MIDFPAEETIRMFLAPGAVFYLKDEALGADSHYHFVLNLRPESDSDLLVVYATSNVDGAKRRTKAFPESLIILTPKEYPEFTRPESAIDCSQVRVTSAEQLSRKLVDKELRFCACAPEDVMCRLRGAAAKSPLIPRKHKRLIIDGEGSDDR